METGVKSPGGSISETVAFSCLVLSSFTMCFSLPAGRAFLALGLIFTVVYLVSTRRLPFLPVTAWLWLLFFVVAIFATVFGVNPELGVPKLRKLIWFMGIPVAAILVTSKERVGFVVRAFAVGSGVRAVRTCVESPMEALQSLRAGEFESFGQALIDTGSMTDGQRLMLGVTVTLGLWFAARRSGRRSVWWFLLLALQALALVITFKRGSWICTCVLVATLVAVKTNWKYLLLFGAIILSTLLVPTVRSRLGDLSREFKETSTGRWPMWTKVAPVLVKEHPWLGVGYRSMTNRMIKQIEWNIELRRDHLHSNPVQIVAATGCIGLFVYLLWMGFGLRDATSFLRTAGAGLDAEEKNHALLLLLMLLGLLLNGLIEYNFGDAELVLIYGLVMGSCAASRVRCE
jgi:O-antigen ligase